MFPTASCCFCGLVLIVCPMQDFGKMSGVCMLLSFATYGFLSIYERQQCTGGGEEGLPTPTVLGMDHPLVAPLPKEFTDMFSDLVFSPAMHNTHDIHLIVPTSWPPKLK